MMVRRTRRPRWWSVSPGVEIPVQFTTHPHQTFQLARCRNEGVAVSRADYLLFLDGDCLIPPDHVLQHLRRRRPGVVMAGYCCRLDRQTSEQLTVEDVRRHGYLQRASRSELQRLTRMDRKARFYNLIRHPSRPKLFGGNMGIYRQDYERVNGYDERFQGWGCEDDDLRLRLRQSGLQIRSILRWTRTYHLWHPRGETTPDAWREGWNVEYLRRGTARHSAARDCPDIGTATPVSRCERVGRRQPARSSDGRPEGQRS